jgi:hypothetical protein
VPLVSGRATICADFRGDYRPRQHTGFLRHLQHQLIPRTLLCTTTSGRFEVSAVHAGNGSLVSPSGLPVSGRGGPGLPLAPVLALTCSGDASIAAPWRRGILSWVTSVAPY